MRLVHYKPPEMKGKKASSLHGRRVAIVDEGTKWLHVVIFDPLHTTALDVPLSDARYMTEIESLPRRRLTPLQSTAKRWLKGAREITKQARAILERAAG